MIDYEKISEYMEKWSQYTYGEGLKYINGLTDNERQSIVKELKELKIFDKIMDGNSMQGLKVDEGKTYIFFSKAFRDCYDSGYLTPIMYFVNLHRQCEEVNIKEEDRIGQLARGVRSFASFLREVDLAYQLKRVVRSRNKNIQVEYVVDPEMDMTKHADIVLKDNNRVVKIWSYLCTTRGIDNTYKRVSGDRGKIEKGYNLLVPYKKINNTKRNNWYVHSPELAEKIIDVIEYKEPVKYYDLIKNSDKSIVESMTYFEVE